MTLERKYRSVKTKLGSRVRLLIGNVRQRTVAAFLALKAWYLLSKLRYLWRLTSKAMDIMGQSIYQNMHTQ